MRATNSSSGFFSGWLANLIAALRTPEEFTCGDCERSEQCGLPPSETCIFKAAQLADGRWKARRRAKEHALELAMYDPRRILRG